MTKETGHTFIHSKILNFSIIFNAGNYFCFSYSENWHFCLSCFYARLVAKNNVKYSD